MFSVLVISFPFFAVIFTGFMTGRMGLFAQSDSITLNRFVFNVAMPISLFGLTSQTNPQSLPDLAYPLIYLGAALLTLFSAYFIGRKVFSLPRPDAGLHAFATSLGNAVFLGLPIAQSIEGWGPAYVVLLLSEGIVIITVSSLLVAGRVDEEKQDLRTGILTLAKRPFQNPLVLGSLGGFLLSLTPINLPETLSLYLGLLGRAAGPVALFSLGLFLAYAPIDRKTVLTPAIGHIALFKLAVLPALAFAGMSIFGITNTLLVGPMMLFTLVPSGVVVYLSASNRGRYETVCATAIGVTTLISIATITGVLYVFT